MARGFGSTRGVGGTDAIAATVTLTPLQRIATFCYFKRNGSGGGGFGRIWDVASGTAGLYFDSGSTEIIFQYTFSGATGLWRVACPSTAWHSIGVDYDPSSTANDPVIYIDGVSVSVTESVAPSGTGSTDGSSALRWGNRSAGDRGWDGDLARIGWWRNGSPTSGEFASMHGGTDPATIQASTLIYYNTLSSTTTPAVGTNVSVTGTADQTDPTFGGGISGNVTLDAVAPAGTLADGGASGLSGGVTLDAVAPAGTLGVAPGAYSIPALTNWSGSVQAAVTVPWVTFQRLADGVQVLVLADQVTDGSGNLAGTSASLAAGTTYMACGWNADGSSRFAAPVTAT